MAAGWTTQKGDGSLKYKCFTTANTGTGYTADDAYNLNYAYNLCYTGYWYNGTNSNNQVGFFDSDVGVLQCYRILPFPRIDNIDSNCAKGRILGMGLKVWSEEAPINTGGYAVGGWLPEVDILNCIDSSDSKATNGANMASIQARMKGAIRKPGIDGVTVRYSPLQDPKQLCANVVKIPDEYVNTSLAGGPPTTPNCTYLEQAVGTAYDVIIPGSFVPSIFWRFNNTNFTGASAITDGIYSLKVMAVVHYEASPKGDSPFMSCRVPKDPAANYIKDILEDWETFPPATGGHSFTSFVNKAVDVVGKVTSGVGRFHKVLTGFDQFAKTYGPIATGAAALM
jgi:hypothetical protein